MGTWHDEQECSGVNSIYCMRHGRNARACRIYTSGITQHDKDEVILNARKFAARHSCPNNGGICLPLAVEVIRELSRCGIRGVLQAGSAQWKCMAIDDGVSPTHFAYMWEMSPTTQMRIASGKLPEMHCWVGIPTTQEIIDASTNSLIEQARLRADIIWTADHPPDYIWSGRDGFPVDARYMVDPIATAVALHFAEVALDYRI